MPTGCYTARMSHVPASPLLLGLACACLATFPACKQTGFKLPKLKFQNKSASTPEAGEPATDPSIPVADVSSRTAEESAFLEKCAALGAGAVTIAGRDGHHFSPTELQRLSQLKDPNAPSFKAAAAAITDYHTQLKRRGIDLILVPVPPKAIIFPDKIDKDLKIKVRRKKPARLDSSLQAFYASLRSQGITLIDPTDELLSQRENKKWGPIYPKTASVWAPRGAETAASLIASGLKGAKWANQPGKDGPLITESASLTFTGPLTSGTPEAETLALRNIGRSADGKMRSVTFSTGGNPLTLIGDHTLLAWREANNPVGASGAFASLADQLAFELQTTPDLFPGKTDGRNTPRLRLLRDSSSGRNPLSATKTLVWVIQATDFALSDWKRVPLRLDVRSGSPGTPMFLAPPIGLIPDPGSPTPAVPPPPHPGPPGGTPPAGGGPPQPAQPRRSPRPEIPLRAANPPCLNSHAEAPCNFPLPPGDIPLHCVSNPFQS